MAGNPRQLFQPAPSINSLRRNGARSSKSPPKSIPINIKQTLNCLSALTNRQHKYHMTRGLGGIGILVLVLAACCFHKQTHTYITCCAQKCFFDKTCKRCQLADRASKRENSLAEQNTESKEDNPSRSYRTELNSLACILLSVTKISWPLN